MTNEYSFISKACYVKSYYPNNLGVRPYMIKLFVHPIPIKKTSSYQAHGSDG